MTKFLSVGVLNTLIDAGMYFALTRWTAFFAAQLVLAKSISYAVGMLNSFYWNRTWTFQSQSSAWRTGALFTATHIVALGINAGVMAVCLELTNMPEAVAIAMATSAAFVWNFGLNKWVVFKS
ncbi:MAG: GtrA family protein [Chloroflexi bacterium]|nr:GtrA family protein [Chloroflexota bacterium]